MLSERSQIQKTYIVCFHLYEMSRTGKPIDRESILSMRVIRENGAWLLISRVSFWSDENILEVDVGSSCITINMLKTTDLSTLRG